MEFSFADLLSIDEIKADVLVNVGDLDQKLLTPGFYSRRVKRCIDELGYTTYFLTHFQDFPTPESLQLFIPSGAFNLNNVFAFNGDCCDVGGMQTVHNKRQFLMRGKTSATQHFGYTSRNNDRNADPLFINVVGDSEILFYAENNGIILLSDSCRLYDHIRVVFSGTPSKIDEQKIIPPFVAEYIVNQVTTDALFALKSKQPNLRLQWLDSQAGLENKKREAIYRLRHLSKSERFTLYEALGRMNY